MLQTAVPMDGYRAIGHGGPGAGICASGGPYAKLPSLDDQASAGTGTTHARTAHTRTHTHTHVSGLAACKVLCDGDSDCSLINLLPDGSCKFRKQCCQTFWSAETAKQGWTSYAKEFCAVAAPSESTPSQQPTSFALSHALRTPATFTVLLLPLLAALCL